MTGLANHQRFTSPLFHDVCPARHMSLFVGVQIGHLTDVVNLAFSHQVTEFASVSAESLRDLLAFRLVESRSCIHENGLFLPFERDTTKSGNQRCFPARSFHRDLKAPPHAIRSINGGLVSAKEFADVGLVFGCQRMEKRLLHIPSEFVEPRDVTGKLIVLDKAAVFDLVPVHNGIIILGREVHTPGWFPSLFVEGAFLFHDIGWYP